MANSTIQLPPRTRLWINGVGLGVWATGVGWLVAHYLLKSQDALGLPNNAAEAWWLKLHGAFGFLSLWTGGFLWGRHVIVAWKTGQHRFSGGTLIGLLIVLMTSGYLLYYLGSEQSRSAIAATHWALGLSLPLAYLIHRTAQPRGRRR